MTLAGLTPPDYRIQFINKKYFWSKRDFPAGKLVAITCLTSAALHAYRLADLFRAAGSTVVLGGPHVTALPDEALRHADSVIIGEAESVWPGVLSDFEAGILKKRYTGEPLDDFFSPVYKYYRRLDPVVLKKTGLHIDRGCKYHCEFCARISEKCRWVKMEQVLELARRIKQAPLPFFMKKAHVVFRSDNIFSSPKYAKELFRRLKALDITWSGNSSMDICFDEEALRLAAESGCRGFLMGFETLRPEQFLKTSLPQVKSSRDYLTAVKNLHRHKIGVLGSFIMGFDEDRPSDFWRLLWFLVRSRMGHCYITMLTPFPGSKLFERLKAENRIFSFNWTRYNFFTCVFKPRRMSVVSFYLLFYLTRLATLVFSLHNIIIYLVLLFSFRLAYEFSYDFMYRLFQ